MCDQNRVWSSAIHAECIKEDKRLRAEVERLQSQVDRARAILAPLFDCDPDIREWLGMPRWTGGVEHPGCQYLAPVDGICNKCGWPGGVEHPGCQYLAPVDGICNKCGWPAPSAEGQPK